MSMFKVTSRNPDENNQTSMDEQNRFSLIELKKIHLQLIENKLVNDSNQNLVIEILRVIAEMVVYGDNKSELLFDFFCEKNMLSLFLQIMWAENGAPLPVHIQILQTLSILISSVKNDTSLYYLLSNNHINDIINYPHALGVDESLDAQFASFIKTLSLRLNEQTVQFFFIEETNGFPLLTKAIELLQINDPMIRISAQTAILNVYQVKDERARDYALHPNVLRSLFDAMGLLMKEQLDSMQKFVDSAGRASEPIEYNKVAQSIDDLAINIEDWLFYLQDLLDLKIEKLQHSFLSFLVSEFIQPYLIDPLCGEDFSINSRFLEIGDLTSESQIPHDSSDQKITQERKAIACLYYFLQITRVLSSPLSHYYFFLVLSHPLSVKSRAAVITALQQRVSDDGSSVEDLLADINKFVEPLVQPNQSIFIRKIAMYTENPRLPLILLLLIGNLVNNIDIDSFYSSPALDKSQGGFSFRVLQCLRFFDGEDQDLSFLHREELISLFRKEEAESLGSEEAENDSDTRRWKKTKSVKRGGSRGHVATPEYLPPPALLLIDKIAAKPFLTTQSESFLHLLGTILQRNSLYSLTAIQVSVFSLWTLFGHCFSRDSPTEKWTVKNPSTAKVIISLIREISRNVSMSFLSLTEVSSESVLTVINEELKRFAGRKWKQQFPKLLSNKEIILRAAEGLDLDYSIPISQVESLRKCIQTFLMVRALYHSAMKLLEEGREPMEHDYFTLIEDRSFLSLDEVNIVTSNFQEGKFFDMKGRKFLDCCVISPPDESNEEVHDGETTVSNNGGSLWSNSTSMFSLGLMSSGKKSQSKNPSSNAKRGKEKERNVNELKLLFVQDPNFLILVSQQRVDGKSVFKIYLAIPLLYTDAKVDLQQKRQFTLIVRSWYPQKNLVKTDSELAFSQDFDTPHRNKAPGSFLRPVEKCCLYRLTLSMETEQASALAVQHIESRRKLLYNQKLDKLKEILNSWICDTSEPL